MPRKSTRPSAQVERPASRLARKIARQLFTNGQGERAERLVLTIDGPFGPRSDGSRDLGGLSEKPAADLIAKALSGESSQQPGAQAERDAIRAYLRRRIKALGPHAGWEDEKTGEPRSAEIAECKNMLRWLDGRTRRYRAKPGGLGGEKAKPQTSKRVKLPEERS